MTAARRIPSVNLDDYRSGTPEQRTRMVGTLGDGLVEFGFLNVEAHGIDAGLIRGTYDLWKRFFELPEEVKKRYVGGSGGARGYTPFGVEHAKNNPTPDLKEFYHVGQEPDAAAALPDGHPAKETYPANVWPEAIPEIKQPTITLFRNLEATAKTLLEALADYFDLPRCQFADMATNGNSLLRILHYPAVPSGIPAGAVRAAAHEDINLITLLCEATDSGLEILTREGDWLAVETGPGEIVVDAGDMLSRHLNEVVPATTHRVVNPSESSRERYSMPFFVHPYSAADLTIDPRFVTPERPAKYPPITAGQFLEQRLVEIGLKK
ncbi:MAG TPA: 2-oxoglutarate and iron-dependent oxygenase domain-containing protein [Thermoanaerobaculia bacterium]|nr:2-oxoglutarate and iron-dependent oxygenase domain-containing protein [Thermoanaerobaculia bacterium]